MIRVDETEVPWHEGMTVSDLLRALDDTYAYAVVRINDKVVSRPHFDTALVPDNAQVYLIPLVAGG